MPPRECGQDAGRHGGRGDDGGAGGRDARGRVDAGGADEGKGAVGGKGAGRGAPPGLGPAPGRGGPPPGLGPAPGLALGRGAPAVAQGAIHQVGKLQQILWPCNPTMSLPLHWFARVECVTRVECLLPGRPLCSELASTYYRLLSYVVN